MKRNKNGYTMTTDTKRLNVPLFSRNHNFGGPRHLQVSLNLHGRTHRTDTTE